MSRIGKQIIEIPQDVKADLSGQTLTISGPKGTLTITIHADIKPEIKDGQILFVPKEAEYSKKVAALWGLSRALVANMVEGVTKGFEKKLDIEGVGYKAAVEGKDLVLNVGFINPVKVVCPEGIQFKVEKNLITVSGFDKALVGQTAAIVRKTKKAEPYKGKGLKYFGEKIRRKEGKKVVSAKK